MPGIIPPTFLADEELEKKRNAICEECEYLFKPTRTCKKCGCFMLAKVKLKGATCPEGKW